MASKVEISGLLRCTGNINSVEIDTSGIINVEGSIKSDIIHGEGYLKANENIDWKYQFKWNLEVWFWIVKKLILV